MKKNVGSQFIGVQMITAADGTDFTGSVTCTIAKDGAALGASGGTGPTHQATGYYEYAPTQAETNADHVAFHFTGTGAISTTVQLYTEFPQTVDNNTILAGLNDIAATDIVSAGAITTASGAVSTVTASLNVTNAITLPSIPNNWITAAGINADAITNAKIADDAIAAENLATGALTADAFAADAIVAATFATDAIAADALAADALTEIQASADAALVANHLDHLFKTAYDATSKPGAADAILNEMVVDNAGVTEYTAAALQNAPSGTGASAATIADAVWNEAVADHVAAGSFGKTDADILADTADLQSNQAAWATATTVTVSDKTGFSLAADQSAVTVGTITTYTGNTKQTADHTAGIADIPTTAEIALRTLLAAEYTVVSDLGTVQTGDTYTLANGTAGFVAIDTVVDAIKAKTDNLTFTATTILQADIQYVNAVQLTGTGVSGDEWGP